MEDTLHQLVTHYRTKYGDKDTEDLRYAIDALSTYPPDKKQTCTQFLVYILQTFPGHDAVTPVTPVTRRIEHELVPKLECGELSLSQFMLGVRRIEETT